MLSEQDEFLLNQLLDGDLSPAGAEALRARIEREPALRQAWARMSRLEGALLDRRSITPRIDLASLHSDIMEGVESSGQPAILKFPIWTRAAGLLSAAAAIVLFFTVFRPAGVPNAKTPIQIAELPTSHRPHDSALPGQIAPAVTPSLAALTDDSYIPSDHVRVAFNRPSSSRSDSVKVSYSRSDSLATEMKARDEERQSRPTVSVLVAQRIRQRTGVTASPFDAPL